MGSSPVTPQPTGGTKRKHFDESPLSDNNANEGSSASFAHRSTKLFRPSPIRPCQGESLFRSQGEVSPRPNFALFTPGEGSSVFRRVSFSEVDESAVVEEEELSEESQDVSFATEAENNNEEQEAREESPVVAFYATPLPMMDPVSPDSNRIADDIAEMLGIPPVDRTASPSRSKNQVPVPISFHPEYDHPLNYQLSKLTRGETDLPSSPKTPNRSSPSISRPTPSPNIPNRNRTPTTASTINTPEAPTPATTNPTTPSRGNLPNPNTHKKPREQWI
ncbi:hypothetical protein HDU98_003210 [Podochytrium sp. JEL0797]|nr:hypothetical protein HDU98_003210 [Podochytrium sp. JEL0797]